MPEFTVKEVRLPELHLPEVKRDEIVRSLSEVHIPEVDLSKARWTRIKVPAMTLTGSDVGKAVAAAAAIVRFVRPSSGQRRMPSLPFRRGSRSPLARIVDLQPRRNRRSRRPIVIAAIIVVGVVVVWALRRPAVRGRLDEATRRTRERLEPVAFTAADTAPIQAEPFADAKPDGGPETSGSEYPDGLGSAEPNGSVR